MQLARLMILCFHEFEKHVFKYIYGSYNKKMVALKIILFYMPSILITNGKLMTIRIIQHWRL